MARQANKTHATNASVAAFLASVKKPDRRTDAQTLDALFRRVTGFEPRLWGPSIVGYGSYHYRYDSGREDTYLATGFSPRAANLVIYIMPGYGAFQPILARLGKHKLGKSCLYLNKLADIDTDVLEELIRAGLTDLATRWGILPSSPV